MKIKFGFITTLFVGIAVLSGCGSNGQNNATETTTTTTTEVTAESTDGTTEALVEGDVFPVTIEHAFGEIVIDEKPERVATVAFGNQDVVLALDVVPVGFSAANFGVQDDSGMLPWTKEKLDELGESSPNIFQDTDGIDFEAVSDSNPDIILAPYSGMTEEEYNLLSEIAPVVAFPETAWTISTEDWVRITARALGLSEKGEEIIQGMENTMITKVNEHPEFEGEKFLWASFDETDLSSIHAYSPVDTRVSFLYKFGFTYPDNVDQYMEEGSYSLSISAENADILYDADFLIGYSSEESYAAAAADPVLGEIPALKNNAVVSIVSGTPLSAALTMTPLSFDYTIDEYTNKLAEAIANVH
ncbi:MAG: ABC transporter substrate-binding protein [Lachnospirales bacterium]